MNPPGQLQPFPNLRLSASQPRDSGKKCASTTGSLSSQSSSSARTSAPDSTAICGKADMPRKYEGVVWRKIKGRRVPYARVYWTDSAGRKRRTERQARTVSEARPFRLDILRELEQGPEAFEAATLVFRELAGKFEEKKLVEPLYVGDTRVKGQRTWKQQRGFLKPLVAHFGNFLVRKITYEHLVEYRQRRFEKPTRRGAQRSVSQVNRELSLMRSIFTYAKRLNIIQRSPFDAGASLISLADEVRRDRILTPDEEKKLLAQCVGQRWRLKYILIAALDTGMRKG